jgi:hypothetical protein
MCRVSSPIPLSYLALELVRIEAPPTASVSQKSAVCPEYSGTTPPGNGMFLEANIPEHWHFLVQAASIFRNHLFLNLLVQDITPG